jgi:hypothetical protein
MAEFRMNFDFQPSNFSQSPYYLAPERPEDTYYAPDPRYPAGSLPQATYNRRPAGSYPHQSAPSNNYYSKKNFPQTSANNGHYAKKNFPQTLANNGQNPKQIPQTSYKNGQYPKKNFAQPPAQNYQKNSLKNTPQLPVVKKQEPCIYWLGGKCKFGENCTYLHPPRVPSLGEILKYQQSKSLTPNVEEGISYSAPAVPGLPALPPNGKCRVCNDNELIIYFIPFYKPIDGVVYFKKIRLYRFNKNKGEYKLVFNYNKQGFHITTAAASNGYLVLSRLPYDAAVLKMMEEAKRLKSQNQKLQQGIKKKDEIHARQMANLRANNRDLSDKLKRKPVSTLRVETQIRIQNVNNNYIDSLNRTIMVNIRAADPVDVFVYDSVLKVHVHVLEYHKPADFVDLHGKTLSLWDKKSGQYHIFYLKLETNRVSDFQLDDPIQPKQLCDVF